MMGKRKNDLHPTPGRKKKDLDPRGVRKKNDADPTTYEKKGRLTSQNKRRKYGKYLKKLKLLRTSFLLTKHFFTAV